MERTAGKDFFNQMTVMDDGILIQGGIYYGSTTQSYSDELKQNA